MFDIGDLLKVEPRPDVPGLKAGIRVSGSRIQAFLGNVKPGDQMIFVLPHKNDVYHQRLSASNLGDTEVAMPMITVEFLKSQLGYIFPDDSYRVDVASIDTLTEAPELTIEPLRAGVVRPNPDESTHARYYSSSAEFPGLLTSQFADVDSHARSCLAASGQLWPSHKYQMLEDMAAGKVACLVSDVDDTLLLTGMTLVIDENLQAGCDRVYQRMKALTPVGEEYLTARTSQQRFQFLQTAIAQAGVFEGTRLSWHAELTQLQDPELYSAHLDAWLNDFCNPERVEPGKITEVQAYYRVLLEEQRESDMPGHCERGMRTMLQRWIESPPSEALSAYAAEQLEALDAVTSTLYYKRPVSADNMECLNRAQSHGVDTCFITSRTEAVGSARSLSDSIHIDSTVSSLSASEVHKSETAMQRMARSTSYLDSRHHCHAATAFGPDGRPFPISHQSTKMLYQTIRMIVQYKASDKFKGDMKYCYLMDDDPYQTHPELIAHCNAIFERFGMRLQWKVAIPCAGGEYLTMAEPPAKMVGPAAICEHCSPVKVVDWLLTEYTRMGGSAELDEEKFRLAYNHAWRQVQLSSSAPLMGAVISGGELPAAAPAAAEPEKRLAPDQAAALRRSLSRLDNTMAAVVTNARDQRKAMEAAVKAKEEAKHLEVAAAEVEVMRQDKTERVDHLSQLFVGGAGSDEAPGSTRGISLEELEARYGEGAASQYLSGTGLHDEVYDDELPFALPLGR